MKRTRAPELKAPGKIILIIADAIKAGVPVVDLAKRHRKSVPGIYRELRELGFDLRSANSAKASMPVNIVRTRKQIEISKDKQIALYLGGMKPKDIATHLDVSYQSVIRAIRIAGVRILPDVQGMAKMYNEGNSMNKVGGAFNINPSHVRWLFMKHGVEIRKDNYSYPHPKQKIV